MIDHAFEHLYPYALGPLLAGGVIVLIALKIMLTGHRSRLVRSVVLFCIGLSIWLLAISLLLILPAGGWQAGLMIVYFAGWLIIPPLFLGFVLAFMGIPGFRAMPAYLVALGLFGATIREGNSWVELNYFGFYPKLALRWALAVDVFYFSVCGLGLLLLYREYLQARESIRRHQARLICLGTAAGFLTAISETISMTARTQLSRPDSVDWSFHLVNLALQGIIIAGFCLYLLNYRRSLAERSYDFLAIHRSIVVVGFLAMFGLLAGYLFSLLGYTLYPLSSYGLLLAIALISYAILKYRFMDMGEFVSRFLVNLLLSSLSVLVYGLIVAAISPRRIEIVPAIVFALLLVMVINPLTQRLQRFVRRRFFRDRYNYQATIRMVSSRVVTVIEHRSLIEILREAIVDTIKVRSFGLFMYDDATDSYQAAALFGLNGGAEGYRFTAGDRLIEAVRRHQNGLFKGEFDRATPIDIRRECLQAFERLHAILILPLMLKGSLRGLLSLGDKESGDVYSTTDIDLLQVLCNQAVIALDNARLYAMAITDDLTKLYIGRYFHQKLEEQIRLALRTGRPLSLIMADLDHFKHVNDTYGHPAGDDVLRGVAAIIREQVRISDITARYGGEEIAVILPETAGEAAWQVAERIRQRLPESRMLDSHRQTISIGLASLDGGDLASILAGTDASFHQAIPARVVSLVKNHLVQRADEALYAAKKAGRNRCENAGIIRFEPIAPLIAQVMAETRRGSLRGFPEADSRNDRVPP